MPLFDTFKPEESVFLKPRRFESNWMGDVGRSLSGVKADGSANLFGSIVEKGLPILGQAVGAYFGGPIGSSIGGAIGNLGVKLQDRASENILAGTDSFNTARETNANEQRNDGVISALSSVAGMAAGALGNSNILSKTGEAATKTDSSLLSKLFGNNGGNTLAGLTNGIQNQYNPVNPANQDMFQMQNQGQTSSILPNPDSNSQIVWLDEKKKTLPSSLPNNMFAQQSQYGFADGGLLYADGDKTEDLFLVDKSKAKELGIDGLLNEISFGQARKGERILDQKSNIFIEQIMDSNYDNYTKKAMLGEHLFDEILTHSDFDGESNVLHNFAEGGKIGTKPYRQRERKILSGYTASNNPLVKPTAKSNTVKEFQATYNLWAKDHNLPGIGVDGKYGKQTAAALVNWNNSNPRTISPQLTGNKITGLTLNAGTAIPLAESITGYDVKGKATTADLAPRAPLTAQVNPLAGDALARVNAETSAVPGTIATNAKKSPGTTNNATSDFQRQNLFGNLTDLATAGIGGLISANNPIPRYERPELYNAYLEDAVARKDQGFTPEEQASINQGLTNNYATNVATVKSVTGGGASQGAVLGALGQASSQLDSSFLQASIADTQQKRQNQGLYRQAVMTDLGIDQNIFQQDQQAALAQRGAGLQLLDSSLQNMQDRSQYNSQYGPGTLYDQLQQAQLTGIQKQNALADSYPAIYAAALKDQLSKKQGTPTI